MSKIIFDCCIAALIGQLFHIFAIKLPSLQTRFRKAKIPFSVKEFFKAEWIRMAGNAVGIVALLFCLDEIFNISPHIAKTPKIMFVFVGFTGSSIVLSLLSKTAVYLNNIIAVKTEEEKTE